MIARMRGLAIVVFVIVVVGGLLMGARGLNDWAESKGVAADAQRVQAQGQLQATPTPPVRPGRP